jgi:triacylglycerol lipase
MGGLDARYMISRLQPLDFKVLSLTTIATPHRGSAFADWCFENLPPARVPRIYDAMERIGLGTGAFQQLTRSYMQNEFNPATPDADGTKYFSYGASFHAPLWSAFRKPHQIIKDREGDNDGLVSVESSRWGEYKGTLEGTSHLDLINWTNRLRWWLWKATGHTRDFNAVALYLGIADMLAKEGF